MKNTLVNPLIRKPIAYVDGKAVYPVRGAEGSGYNTEGDLLQLTSDGRDLNGLWAEFQATLAIFNERRATLVNTLTYPVVNVIEDVPQVGSFDMDEASEYGEPTGARVELGIYSLAFDFKDYDKATRYTWKFLRDAPASHLEAIHNAMLEADSRLIFRKVMESLFDNTNRAATIKGQNYTVYSLYNGDGTVPPTYKNTTFAGSHSHYMVSGAVLCDSGDLEDMYATIKEHGYGIEQGTQFVLLANSLQTKEIRKFKAGVTVNGTLCNFDFIPAPGQPSMIVPNQQGLIGLLPPSSWNGLPVIGSYMNILIIEEDYIPAGYALMYGTGGDGNLQNPVGLREHANPAYRGLRLIGGDKESYPLRDAFYSRGFGTGVRQRAGAAVMQFSAPGAYVVPPAFKRGGGLG